MVFLWHHLGISLCNNADWKRTRRIWDDSKINLQHSSTAAKVASSTPHSSFDSAQGKQLTCNMYDLQDIQISNQEAFQRLKGNALYKLDLLLECMGSSRRLPQIHDLSERLE